MSVLLQWQKEPSAESRFPAEVLAFFFGSQPFFFFLLFGLFAFCLWLGPRDPFLNRGLGEPFLGFTSSTFSLLLLFSLSLVLRLELGFVFFSFHYARLLVSCGEDRGTQHEPTGAPLFASPHFSPSSSDRPRSSSWTFPLFDNCI